MKLKKTQDSFHTILKIVIGVVFAVAILALSYKAATTSQENRSKAAETLVTYKSWEFNGTTTEGWLLTNLSGTRVTGGLLTAKVTGSPTSPVTLVNKSVGSILPQGNKYIKLRLAVAGSAGSPPKSVSETTINTKFPSPAPVSFSISVRYTNKGAPRVTPQIRGVADGKLYEYSVILPDFGGVTIDSVQLVLSSIKTSAPIQLDYVRLVGSRPTPTPTSTPRAPTPTPARPTPTPTCYKTCSANGVCTIVCSQPVTPKPTITPTRYPTPIAQAACNYSCSTNLNCLSGLICYSGVCRNPSCIGQTNCSCPPGPTATPLVTPNPSKCVLNGGKCESLYTNCPTPDNQLPYDCGMGYRCIPSTMVCH